MPEMKDRSGRKTSRLQQLRRRYLRSIPEKLRQLEDHWASLGAEHGPNEAVLALRQEVQQMAGASSSYGFHSLSELAIALEQALSGWWETQDDPHLRQTMERRYARLIAGLQQLTVGVDTQMSAHPVLEASRQKTKGLIFLVEDDQVAGLPGQLRSRGYNIRLFPNTDGVIEQIVKEKPLVVVLDITLDDDQNPSLNLATELASLELPAPELIFLSSRGDFEARLKAVRSGSVAYMVKPISLPVLMGTLDQLLERRGEPRARVLIAESDADTAEFHQLSLQGAGIDAVTIADTTKLIEHLADLKPDLVLMDFRLPSCNSLDLVRMIRQYSYHASLPIILLAPEADDDVTTAALQAGADDCITKPPPPALLTALVANRLRRFRDTLRVTDRDHLTGALTRAAFLSRLNGEVLRAKRLGMPLVLVMIDVDHFKRVNDNYGHLTGDSALRMVADTLVRRLRKTDLIGRYSGDEFVLLLPDTQGPIARKLLEQIRVKVAELITETQDGPIRITLSIGAALLNPESEGVFFVTTQLTDELLETADTALYEAKRNGRNQVILRY